jgi:hypothetical protein
MVYKWIKIKKNRKWENHPVEHGICVSCTEKYRQWETHSVEHGI